MATMVGGGAGVPMNTLLSGVRKISGSGAKMTAGDGCDGVTVVRGPNNRKDDLCVGATAAGGGGG
jgi:hypothetical protein